MGRSKLRAALAAQKNVDIKKMKDKKKHKAALKSKAKPAGLLKADESDDDDEDEEEEEEEEEWEDEEEEGEETNGLIDDEAEESGEDDEDEDSEDVGADFIAAMDDSDESDSEVEMEAKIVRPKAGAPVRTAKKDRSDKKKEDDDDEEEEEEEEEEDEELAWSDLDEEERAGLVVRRRQTINNKAALTAAWTRIRLPITDAKTPFSSHQCVTAEGPATAEAIPDVQDDVARELQLYRQSRAAAVAARRRLRAEGVPFTRPGDYFAEMVKDDGHMAQVRAKLVEAATAKKAAAEARKQRDLKKFGKQVQVVKLQERAQAKRATLDKINSLKRKRQDNGATSTHEADLFDVAVDHELGAGSTASAGQRRPGAGAGAGARHQPNAKRQKKNERFGFGGKKRFAKSGDAMSSGDLSGFNMRRKSGPGGGGGGGFKAQRPGKSRRKAAAGRR